MKDITKEVKAIFGDIIKQATSQDYTDEIRAYDFMTDFDGDTVTITFTNDVTVQIGNSEWGYIRRVKE